MRQLGLDWRGDETAPSAAAPEPVPDQVEIDWSRPFAETPWTHWLRWVEQWAASEPDAFLAAGSRMQRGHGVSVRVREAFGLPTSGACSEDLRPTLEETLAVIRASIEVTS